MFFSIIVPVYNTFGDYLEACMKSLLTQAFSDLEILLIDDGSRPEWSGALFPCGKNEKMRYNKEEGRRRIA